MACRLFIGIQTLFDSLHGRNRIYSYLQNGYECENGSIKSMVTPNPLRTRSRIPFTQKLWHYRTQPDLAECNNKLVTVYAPPL